MQRTSKDPAKWTAFQQRVDDLLAAADFQGAYVLAIDTVGPGLLGYLRALVDNDALVEELFQEALLLDPRRSPLAGEVELNEKPGKVLDFTGNPIDTTGTLIEIPVDQRAPHQYRSTPP